MADTPRQRRPKKSPPAGEPPAKESGTPSAASAQPVKPPESEVLPAPTAKRRRPPGSPRPGAPRATSKAKRPAARAETEETEVEETEEVEPNPEVEADTSSDADAWSAEDESSGEGEATVPAERALAPARTADLAKPDLLQRYMAEVNRYPLLSREEETRLAREFVATQDPDLARRLVTANLRLVVKIAWEYRRAAFNLLDLIQEGNVGLMQGVKKFDPERGVKLSTYAAWWIRAYIIRHLMDNWRLVKLGTTAAQRKIFFNLRKEKERLAKEGFEPEPKLLAERLQVSEQDVIDMDRRLGNDEFSLDTPIGDDSRETYADRVTQTGPSVDERLAEEEVAARFREQLAAFAKTLAPDSKEKYIFEKRLVADEPQTLQEIGNHYGISRERARQIEARLTQKLKDHMREYLPDFEALSLTPPDAD